MCMADPGRVGHLFVRQAFSIVSSRTLPWCFWWWCVDLQCPRIGIRSISAKTNAGGTPTSTQEVRPAQKKTARPAPRKSKVI